MFLIRLLPLAGCLWMHFVLFQYKFLVQVHAFFSRTRFVVFN